MAPRSKIRDSGLVPCEDNHVVGHGRERCLVGVRVLEGSDRDGSGHCGYGRDEHGCEHHDRGVHGRDVHGHVGNDHRVDGRYDAGQLRGNALNGHVRPASAHAHAHDAHGRKRSYQ